MIELNRNTHSYAFFATTTTLRGAQRAADKALVSRRHMTIKSPHPLAQGFTGVVVRASGV